MLQMAPKGSTLTPAQARLRQQYLTWLRWWRSTVSPEDYLKFVAQKVSKACTVDSVLYLNLTRVFPDLWTLQSAICSLTSMAG